MKIAYVLRSNMHRALRIILKIFVLSHHLDYKKKNSELCEQVQMLISCKEISSNQFTHI